MSQGIFVFATWFVSLYIGLRVIPARLWARVPKWVANTIYVLFLIVAIAVPAALPHVASQLQQEGAFVGLTVAGALVGPVCGLLWAEWLKAESGEWRRAQERRRREQGER